MNAGADYIAKLSRLSNSCHQAPSHPFSNDGECPEELHLTSRPQVRALPVMRKHGSSSAVEQLDTFLTSLSPSPLFNLNHHLWRMPERTTSKPAGANPAPQQCGEVSPSLSPSLFIIQSPQMVTNADETTWLLPLRSWVRIPPVPPFQFHGTVAQPGRAENVSSNPCRHRQFQTQP